MYVRIDGKLYNKVKSTPTCVGCHFYSEEYESCEDLNRLNKICVNHIRINPDYNREEYFQLYLIKEFKFNKINIL